MSDFAASKLNFSKVESGNEKQHRFTYHRADIPFNPNPTSEGQNSLT